MLRKKIDEIYYSLFPTVNLRKQEINVHLIRSLKNKYSRRHVLLSIPTTGCVTGIYWGLNGQNPFVLSLKRKNIKPLKEFYDQFQPKNTAELLQVDIKGDYGTLPPYAYILPWDKREPQKALALRREYALKENAGVGHEGMTLEEGGHTDFGPVKEEKLEVEAQRLKNLSDSIKRMGYIERVKNREGTISGYFLLGKEEKWKVYIDGGKHRAYVLAAMDNQKIPIRLNLKMGVIDVREIEKWPQVKKGNFTVQEALEVFNHFVD